LYERLLLSLSNCRGHLSSKYAAKTKGKSFLSKAMRLLPSCIAPLELLQHESMSYI
jgi:hypothetical protein